MYISFIEEKNKWLATFNRLERPDLAGPYALQGGTFIQPSLSKWLVNNCVGEYLVDTHETRAARVELGFYIVSIWFELERDVILFKLFFWDKP